MSLWLTVFLIVIAAIFLFFLLGVIPLTPIFD